MRKTPAFARMLLWVLNCLLLSNTHGQVNDPKPIRFKSGLPRPAFLQQEIRLLPPGERGSGQPAGPLYFLRFRQIPTASTRSALSVAGIELLEYIPENIYLARVKGKWAAGSLLQYGIAGVEPLTARFKRSREETAGRPATGSYQVYLAPGTPAAVYAARYKGQPIHDRLLECSFDAATLDSLLQDPAVLYILPAPQLKALTAESTELLGADQLQAGSPAIPALDGSGVVMGIGDNGQPYHIDLGFNEPGQSYSGGDHATPIAGIAAGAGNRDPSMKGFAPRAHLIMNAFNNIIYNAPVYYQDSSMRLTNNSYGAGSSCEPVSGLYSGLCWQADQQLYEMPELLHVFAAGNSGDLTCTPYPAGYKTIDNSYQAAKNVLTVTGTDKRGNLVSWFSRGPSMDGRIKPEITAIGGNVRAPAPNNNYLVSSGTSSAAPMVTGGLALLSQRYRQLHGGANPPGDLLKAVICNSATDLGRKGVDYEYGFGWMNLPAAIDLISNGRYRSGSINHGEDQVIDLQIDKEVYNYKIMLYWTDLPSSLFTSQNLVNDLDLSVTYPDGTVHYPLVPDTSAAGMTSPAQEREDHLNNIEQVVLDHALPGTYRVRIKGYAVPFGPQRFQLVYHWDEPGFRLLHPAGGEKWKPGQAHTVQWSDAGRTDNYQVAFSANGGQGWTELGSTGTGTLSFYSFTLPSVSSNNCLVRVTAQSSGQVLVSPAFSILPEIGFSIASPCSSQVNVHWTKPAGIDSVRILLYENGGYQEKGISTLSDFSITGLQRGALQWVALEPVWQGITGQRSLARSLITAAAGCPPMGPPGDLSLKSIVQPVTWRAGTIEATGDSAELSVLIQNEGATAFNDSVELNVWANGTLHAQEAFRLTLPAGRSQNLTLAKKIAAIPGSQTKLEAQIVPRNDPTPGNNNSDTTWRYLANAPIVLPYGESFRNLADTSFGRPGYMGLPGAEAWDFISNATSLRLLTGAPAGGKGLVAYSRIDGQSLQLKGTFNLSNYQVDDNIKMGLGLPDISLHYTECSVRGSDTSQWLNLPLYDTLGRPLPLHQLNVGGLLAEKGQALSTSFQVLLQYNATGFVPTIQALDSFRLFTAAADLALTAATANKTIVTDGDSLRLRLTVSNGNAQARKDVAAGWTLPGGQSLQTRIDSIPGMDSVVWESSIAVSNWPGSGAVLTAWIQDPEDDNTLDDTLRLTVQYGRKIEDYPYLEGFESGAAGWSPSYVYQLNTEVGQPADTVRAANGEVFWKTRWLNSEFGVPYVEAAGVLTSPAFQLQGLQKPYLSMSIFRQLCNGLDSVFVQVSADTGRTWTFFQPGTGTSNWYDTLAGRSWTGCGDAYWMGVSAPLPTGEGLLRFRVFSSPRSDHSLEFPRSAGGLYIDDIHVYDLLYPVYAGPVPLTAVTENKNGAFTWLLGNGQVLAVSTASGLSASLVAEAGGGWFRGNPVMNRVWLFSNQALAGKKETVRLYFTHADWLAWSAANGCTGCSTSPSPYELAVFRYAGPVTSLDGFEGNDLAGYDQQWGPEAFRLVPYGDGYYVEVEAPAYGAFYLGLAGDAQQLRFNAVKEEGADAVWLDWSLEHTEGILSYTVERALKTNGPAPVFAALAQIQQQGSAGTYRYHDQQLQSPATYYYRLKITQADGRTRYSAIRTIGFEKEPELLLYPNPYTGSGPLKLLLKNMEGHSADIRLYDATGRLLWTDRLGAVAGQQEKSLESAVKGLPAGIYLLKTTIDGQKRTIRLVVSGK